MSVKMLLFAAAQSAALEVTGSNCVKAGAGASSCGNPGATGSPNLVITNGSGSYTYAWTQIGAPADSGPYTPSNAAIKEPVWSGGPVCDGDNNTEQWRCLVTDTLYGQSDTVTINVTRSWVFS